MTSTLNDAYLEWLTGQIKNTHRQRRSRTYWDLMVLLHNKEFVWLVQNDDNRVQDGLDLRSEFQTTVLGTDAWLDFWDYGCSVLEVIIALSRRLAFTIDSSPELWAWNLIDNLHLGSMHDPLSRKKQIVVDDILENLIWRTYEPDGTGGFFPLAFPKEDQTKIEIWYQMHSYIDELLPN